VIWAIGPSTSRLKAACGALDDNLQRLKTDASTSTGFIAFGARGELGRDLGVLRGARRAARQKVLYVGSSNFAGWHITQAE